MKIAEDLVVKRRNTIQHKHYMDLKRSTARHLTYHEKITYIENSIERDIQFFDFKQNLGRESSMDII
jgi:hypothetical protein